MYNGFSVIQSLEKSKQIKFEISNVCLNCSYNYLVLHVKMFQILIKENGIIIRFLNYLYLN